MEDNIHFFREADFIVEIDRLREENADLRDQVDALILQVGLAVKTLRQVADALAAAIQSSQTMKGSIPNA